MIRGTREEILKRIGSSIRGHRLQANITQQMLAERSGVSLNAIRHLESGVGASLGTFVQACRSLGKDRWIIDLEPKEEISPIKLANARPITTMKMNLALFFILLPPSYNRFSL